MPIETITTKDIETKIMKKFAELRDLKTEIK